MESRISATNRRIGIIIWIHFDEMKLKVEENMNVLTAITIFRSFQDRPTKAVYTLFTICCCIELHSGIKQ